MPPPKVLTIPSLPAFWGMAMGWRDSTAQQRPKHWCFINTVLATANFIPEKHYIIKCTNLQDINFLPFLFRNWSGYYAIPRSSLMKLILLSRINIGLNHIYLLPCNTGDNSKPLENVLLHFDSSLMISIWNTFAHLTA